MSSSSPRACVINWNNIWSWVCCKQHRINSNMNIRWSELQPLQKWNVIVRNNSLVCTFWIIILLTLIDFISSHKQHCMDCEFMDTTRIYRITFRLKFSHLEISCSYKFCAMNRGGTFRFLLINFFSKIDKNFKEIK